MTHKSVFALLIVIAFEILFMRLNDRLLVLNSLFFVPVLEVLTVLFVSVFLTLPQFRNKHINLASFFLNFVVSDRHRRTVAEVISLLQYELAIQLSVLRVLHFQILLNFIDLRSQITQHFLVFPHHTFLRFKTSFIWSGKFANICGHWPRLVLKHF